jgi:hypothetical protein
LIKSTDNKDIVNCQLSTYCLWLLLEPRKRQRRSATSPRRRNIHVGFALGGHDISGLEKAREGHDITGHHMYSLLYRLTNWFSTNRCVWLKQIPIQKLSDSNCKWSSFRFLCENRTGWAHFIENEMAKILKSNQSPNSSGNYKSDKQMG